MPGHWLSIRRVHPESCRCMTEETANTIALWLLLPSMAVVIVIVGVRAWGVPFGVRQRRRAEQLKTLRELARTPGSTLEFDWQCCRNIAFAELRRELGRRGWRFVDEEVTPTAWLLRFSNEVGEPVDNTKSRQALRAELSTATLNADGFYLLDTSRYGDLTSGEIARIVHDSGWRKSGKAPIVRGEVARVTQSGTTIVSTAQDPFAGASVPDELRTDPEVLARAAEIAREKGFDPLAPQVLEHARDKHRAWGKRFNRQAALAFLYGFVGVFLFAGSVVTAEGERFYLLLTVSLVVLALFVLTVVKASTIRRKWREEIGPILDAYEELRALARREK
ncbi:hypothetical protein AB8O38_00495 [Saccharomonospora xinjiangensis]|uniref:hypothetical protein n=1 Tax=Saccharomonospora xinjiangensis TaxID=75294 RepID=UPI003510D0EE